MKFIHFWYIYTVKRTKNEDFYISAKECGSIPCVMLVAVNLTAWKGTQIWWYGGIGRRWQLLVDLVTMLWKLGIIVKRTNPVLHERCRRLPSIAGSSPSTTSTLIVVAIIKSKNIEACAAYGVMEIAIWHDWKKPKNCISVLVSSLKNDWICV